MHTGRQKYPAWTSGSESCPSVQEEARSRSGTEADIPHESAVRACRRARRRENTSARCRQNKSRTSSPRAWRPSAARRQRPCGPLGCTMTRGGAQRGTFRPYTPPHCAHGPYKGRGRLLRRGTARGRRPACPAQAANAASRRRGRSVSAYFPAGANGKRRSRGTPRPRRAYSGRRAAPAEATLRQWRV